MTAITELGLAGIATSTLMVPDWSLPDWSTGTTSAIASERPNGAHVKADAMPVVAFDVPDVVNVQSLAPQSPVIRENTAIHSPSALDALLPPGMTDQQILTGIYRDVISPHRISRVAFEAAWRDDNNLSTNSSVDRPQTDLFPTQKDVILSATSQLSPITPADQDEAWNNGVARRAYERLARETHSTVADIRAMKPGSDLANEIAKTPHLRKVLYKAQSHESYLPEREAYEAATAARDAMVDHVAYMQGKPASGIKLEGYNQWLDVKSEHPPKPLHSVPGETDSGVVIVGPDDKPIYEGRRPHYIRLHKQVHTLGQAQDLALIAEEARNTADAARDRATKATRVYGRIGTPQKVVLFTTLAAVLASCGSGGVVPPKAPTLPPPDGGVPPTSPQLTPEASPTMYASATPVVDAGVQLQVAPPDVLPEPDKLQVVAGLSSVFLGQGEVLSTAPLDDRITKALNAQGVQPFFGYDNKGNSIFSADVAVKGGKAVCLPSVPEKIADRSNPQHVFNYIPDGAASPVVGFGKPDLLGKAGGSDNVIRYGVTANGQTDIAGILSPVLPSVDNTSCAYGSVTNPDITPNPNDFVGAMVAVHFDKDGNIVAYNSPVLVDPSKVAINVQGNGEALLNGQPMESRIWVSTATAITLPSGTATMTATVPATIPPPATETPVPTATPAELPPTSCKDIPSVQPIADKFLQEKGYASWAEAIKAAGITSMDQLKTLYASEAIAFRQAIILNFFDFDVSIPKDGEIPGFEGSARCVIFAAPTSLTDVKLLPVIISATRNDGVESGSTIRDNPSGYGIFLPADVDAWIKGHKGKAVEVVVNTVRPSWEKVFIRPIDGVPNLDRTIMKPFFGYTVRHGSSDVWGMIEDMNSNEPGLLVNLIMGEPDF